jgi:hypothetical protein
MTLYTIFSVVWEIHILQHVSLKNGTSLFSLLSSIARLNCTSEGKGKTILQSFFILCSRRWWKERQWLMFNMPLSRENPSRLRWKKEENYLIIFPESGDCLTAISGFHMRRNIFYKVVRSCIFQSILPSCTTMSLFFSPLLHSTGWLQLRWGCQDKSTILYNVMHFRLSVESISGHLLLWKFI